MQYRYVLIVQPIRVLGDAIGQTSAPSAIVLFMPVNSDFRQNGLDHMRIRILS